MHADTSTLTTVANDYGYEHVFASLVVGVNTDASARRQGKGGDRPVNPLADRMAVLESASLVVAFDEDPSARLIEQLRPQHLVKGGDWPPVTIVGADFVRAYGGRVPSIPFRHQRPAAAHPHRTGPRAVSDSFGACRPG